MCLDQTAEAFFVKALKQLKTNLSKPPTNITLELEQAPSELANILEQKRNIEAFIQLVFRVEDKLVDLYHNPQKPSPTPRLLVFCKKSHWIAKMIRNDNPNALWGGCCNPVAVVWQPEHKTIIWHEAMHLLGVSDCYKGEPITDFCEKQPGCLMQYAPTESNVYKWPKCLCTRAIEELKRPHYLGNIKDGFYTKHSIEKQKTDDKGLYRYCHQTIAQICESKKAKNGLLSDYKGYTLIRKTLPISTKATFEQAKAKSKSFKYPLNKLINEHKNLRIAEEKSINKKSYRIEKNFTDDSSSIITYNYEISSKPEKI